VLFPGCINNSTDRRYLHGNFSPCMHGLTHCSISVSHRDSEIVLYVPQATTAQVLLPVRADHRSTC
jgi:hypothetical protein